jgi:hypothetical protein
MQNKSGAVYGICPDTAGCQRSYLKGQALIKGFKDWIGMAFMPGSGDGTGPRDESLENLCCVVFQAQNSPNGYCDSCGKELMFVVHPTPLGSCPKCRRLYSNLDLNLAFCPKCGTPVEIEESIRERIRHDNAIAMLLSIAPDLQQFHYL